MAEELTEIQIPFDTTHYIHSPKKVVEVLVQTSDLDGLVWHTEKIKDPYGQIDFCALFAGASISQFAQFFYNWYDTGMPSLILALISVGLCALSIFFFLFQKKKSDASKSRHAISEVKHDLEVIYHKINLPYPKTDNPDKVCHSTENQSD